MIVAVALIEQGKRSITWTKKNLIAVRSTHQRWFFQQHDTYLQFRGWRDCTEKDSCVMI